MKKLFLILSLLIPFTSAIGQIPYYNAHNYGNEYNRIKIDSSLAFSPLDTNGLYDNLPLSTPRIRFSSANGLPYFWNGSSWKLFAIAGNYVTIPIYIADSTQNSVNIADTANRLQLSLNNKIEYPLYDTLTVFNTNLQGSLPAGFTLVGTHGTFTANGLLFNGNNGTYTDYIEYNTATMVEKCVQSITFVWQGKTTADYGIQVGFHSINPFGYEHTVNGTYVSNKGTIFTGLPAFDINEGHSTFFGSVADTAYSVGDTMRFDLLRYETTYTITITNITKKWSINYIQPTSPSGSPFAMHNTSNPRVSDLGLNALLINWKYYILKPKNLNSIVIGNSITGGQAAPTNARFVNLLNGYSKDIISGGGADGVGQALAACKEKINLAPKYALIMMGGNDILFKVDSNTWQANYHALRDTLVHAGITVIHLLPTPRTATDERPLKNYIQRTFTTDHIIDTWTPLWDNTTLYSMLPVYNSGDSTHPNTAGHAVMAATINIDTSYKQQQILTIDTFNTIVSNTYASYIAQDTAIAVYNRKISNLSSLQIKGFTNTSGFQVGTSSTHLSAFYVFLNSDSSAAMVLKNKLGNDAIAINSGGASFIKGSALTTDDTINVKSTGYISDTGSLYVGNSAVIVNIPTYSSGGYSLAAQNTTSHRIENITVLTTTSTLDFPSTSAQTSSDLTITLTGAAVGDIPTVGVPNSSVLSNSSFSCWVSAANTVTVRFNNYSSGALDPTSGSFKVSIIKY